MEYIPKGLMKLVLDVQQKTNKHVIDARLVGGRWQVYCCGHWYDMSGFLKTEGK